MTSVATAVGPVRGRVPATDPVVEVPREGLCGEMDEPEAVSPDRAPDDAADTPGRRVLPLRQGLQPDGALRRNVGVEQTLRLRARPRARRRGRGRRGGAD